jgi:murein DD-endopeptidase MepM/ murein hydrolase activator NlpD
MKLIYPLNREPFITQKYGANPQNYDNYKIGGVALKGHEGLDLRSPTGTEVVACDDGFVQEEVDQGKVGYGKYIKLVHSWGESVVAHLQEFKVKQGTQVKAGQIIAISDNTGNSTASHLHFGVRLNPYKRDDGWGGYSDPEPFLFGTVSEELDMPKWAKNLQPYFIENNLKNDQIEGVVRSSFSDSKILKGFVEKWADKLQVDKDLGKIEKELQELTELEDIHIELISTCEQVVGHFETESALRDALRAVKQDITGVGKTNTALIKDNATLRSKRTLDKYETKELFSEIFLRIIGRK